MWIFCYYFGKVAVKYWSTILCCTSNETDQIRKEFTRGGWKRGSEKRGVENVGWDSRNGKRRSGKSRTRLQQLLWKASGFSDKPRSPSLGPCPAVPLFLCPACVNFFFRSKISTVGVGETRGGRRKITVKSMSCNLSELENLHMTIWGALTTLATL